MSRTITVEVSDEEYQALSDAGQATGETPGEALRRLAQREQNLGTVRHANEEVAAAAIEATIAAEARRTGRAVEEMRAEWAAAFPPLPSHPMPTEPDPYCGALEIDDLDGSDNDRIDHDLADEYSGRRIREG
ncbi:MAG: hypothetical protein IT340_15190 [Chloroflexi bacterium]|nr:hypothetical protein [Chloroflexota bacterium]